PAAAPVAGAPPSPVRVPEAPAPAVPVPAAPAPGWSLALLIVAVYGGAVAALAAWTLVGLVQLRRLYRTAYPAPEPVVTLFRAIAGPAGARVRLLASDRVQLPL